MTNDTNPPVESGTRIWAESFTPLSVPGPGQTLCPNRATGLEPAGDGQPWQCTREYGHEQPCEASSATGTVYARWVTWEHPGDRPGARVPLAGPPPVIVPAPSRPARIAALHAAGLFLAEHVDLPMPTTVLMTAYDVPPARFQALAQLHGADIRTSANGAHRWINIPVTLETLHGIEIQYTAHEER